MLAKQITERLLHTLMSIYHHPSLLGRAIIWSEISHRNMGETASEQRKTINTSPAKFVI
jgi:hypothetical protein